VGIVILLSLIWTFINQSLNLWVEKSRNKGIKSSKFENSFSISYRSVKSFLLQNKTYSQQGKSDAHLTFMMMVCRGWF
jgi:hypothetical protein